MKIKTDLELLNLQHLALSHQQDIKIPDKFKEFKA